MGSTIRYKARVREEESVCIDPAGAVLTQALGFRLRRLPRPPLLPSATRDNPALMSRTGVRGTNEEGALAGLYSADRVTVRAFVGKPQNREQAGRVPFAKGRSATLKPSFGPTSQH